MKNSTALALSAAIVAVILAPPIAGGLLGGYLGGSAISVIGGIGWGALAGATPYALFRMGAEDDKAPKNKIARFFYEGMHLYTTGLMGAAAVAKEGFTSVMDKLFAQKPEAQPAAPATPEAPSTFAPAPAATAFAESAPKAQTAAPVPPLAAPQNTVSGVDAKPGV